uniref:ATP synthase F0 subunit 8 n=1 Tax=Chaetodipus penicillatus TaxID=38672 RepID=UPI00226D3357|nr:ATP synthase F0 subunit 8 [Chaetodipus penicillatus]UZH94557.1 ATP synthase F0 subunit 8 [Chaetodipus penicillatus]
MPQLDTAPWFMVSVSTLIALFVVFQLKLKDFNFFSHPNLQLTEKSAFNLPWEEKWTKTCLPLSLSHHI